MLKLHLVAVLWFSIWFRLMKAYLAKWKVHGLWYFRVSKRENRSKNIGKKESEIIITICNTENYICTSRPPYTSFKSLKHLWSLIKNRLVSMYNTLIKPEIVYSWHRTPPVHILMAAMPLMRTWHAIEASWLCACLSGVVVVILHKLFHFHFYFFIFHFRFSS